MADDLATLQQRLSEAQAAYHRLLTGTAVTTIKDQNGEMVTYQAANSSKLAAYISALQDQINALLGIGRSASGPMRIWM